MAKKEVVYRFKNYVVLDVKSELIVKDDKGEYENHAHFTRKTDKRGRISLRDVKTCIDLCHRKRMDIKSDYMLEAVIRLTIDKKYKQDLLRKQEKEKKKYINTSQKNLR